MQQISRLLEATNAPKSKVSCYKEIMEHTRFVLDARNLIFHYGITVNAMEGKSYEALVEKFADRGMEPNSAEEKAGPIIAKKFYLPPNWTLYVGGLEKKQFSGADFNVDSSDARDSLGALDACMRGKIIRMMSRCE